MTINKRNIAIKALLGLTIVAGIFYVTIVARPVGFVHGSTTTGKPYKAKITGETKMTSLSSKAELSVYNSKNKLIAKKDNLDKDWSFQELHTVKPSNNSLDDLLFYYRSAGMHGYALSVFRVNDDSIEYVTCDKTEKENTFGQFGGDGGIPKFEQLVSDFDNDGNLEVKNIYRDWEQNASQAGETIKYIEDIAYNWNGSCFEKIPQYSAQSCTDGSQCPSSWCVDHRCLEYKLNMATIGDYKARKVFVNGKSFLVSALNSTLTLTTDDENDSDFLQLKDKLCKPYENQNTKKDGLLPVKCVVQEINN